MRRFYARTGIWLPEERDCSVKRSVVSAGFPVLPAKRPSRARREGQGGESFYLRGVLFYCLGCISVGILYVRQSLRAPSTPTICIFSLP